MAALLLGSPNRFAAADEPPATPWTLPTLFKQVPPLKHDAKGRWPMICIEPFKLSAEDKSFADAKPFPPEVIRELMKRGLTQFLPPREQYIPFALALQNEGSKVILMEGAAFNGPAGDVPDGLHHLPADFKRDPNQPAQQPHYPCPLLLEGWRKKANDLRATFGKFKAAGVNVDAVWLDWEIEPAARWSQWQEAKACERCQKQFPPGVLDNFDKYCAFILRWRVDLFSAYVVAPILELYPRCSVTNWEQVISTAARPTVNWSAEDKLSPVGLGMFTAANPVAYGNTIWYRSQWKPELNWPLDESHMDRIYTHVMLSEISDHVANAMLAAPEKQCIPWVDRFCADDRDEKIPILTRKRYRELLRHIWLRGADGMQIFNPNWFPDRPERVRIVTEEIEDATAIYDEMLEYRPFLENGRVMNTSVPTAEQQEPIWSGRQIDKRAIVRVFTQDGVPARVKLEMMGDGGKPVGVTLDCPADGGTFQLTLDGSDVQILPMP